MPEQANGWRLPSDPPQCPEGGVVPVIVGLLTETGEWDLHTAFYAAKKTFLPLGLRFSRDRKPCDVSGFVCYNDVDNSFDEISLEAWHPFPDPPTMPL